MYTQYIYHICIYIYSKRCTTPIRKEATRGVRPNSTNISCFQEMTWTPDSENMCLCLMCKGISEPTFPGAETGPPLTPKTQFLHMKSNVFRNRNMSVNF